jgi:iron complex transport system substrate-binding protein
MRNSKKWLALIIASAMAVGTAGCAGKAKETEAVTNSAETTASEATVASEASKKVATEEDGQKAGESAEAQSGMRTITDSAGREIQIPVEINKVAPSGPLAQIVLYTISPDKLGGLASDFSEEAKQYIDEKYWGLPKFGQFYGKNANLNMEALIAEAPDVIIDIGEAKKSVKEDMDALQEQLNIPVIFVEATLPTMAEAYELLGEITGETEQAAKLAEYCTTELTKAEEIKNSLTDDQKKSVYFGVGNNGLHTNARGSIHADVIEWIGAINAADVEAVSKGTGSEVSFEQVLLWDPDFIILDSQELYDQVTADAMWKELTAVSEGRVYKIPTAPYNFMANPPSVNRLIGIQWLGQLVYPEQYTEDIKEKAKEFFELFYHIDVTEEQLEEILKNS